MRLGDTDGPKAARIRKMVRRSVTGVVLGERKNNEKRLPTEIGNLLNLFWSGRRDSNSRPLAPHASALPGCATPRLENEV